MTAIKPIEYYKPGDKVVHQGTKNGTNKGEIFTVTSKLMNGTDGETGKDIWAYQLEKNGYVVYATQDSIRILHEPAQCSFDGLISHIKGIGQNPK